MSLLLESAIKGSVILGLALASMPLLRTTSAAFRHWVLSAALFCAAVAPVLALVAPSWNLPAGLASPSRVVAPPHRTAEPEISVAWDERVDPTARQVEANPRRAMSFDAAVKGTWLAGVVFGITVLLVGFARLARLASRARRIDEGPWSACTEQVRREFGIGRPVTLMQGSEPALLVTWGLLRPKLIVPPAARHWGDDRIRLVLYHELAHVRRGDWIVQLAAELLRIVYWFNPIAWIACVRLRQESEQACDDAVLNRGVDGPEYALNLVDIARDLRHPRLWMPGTAIARSSKLERRVRAMLDSRLDRRPVSRRAGGTALAGLLTITIAMSGLAASQATLATVSGSIVDPMNAALPDVAVVLTNVQTQAKNEVRSDRTGRYEVVGLVPGEYLLEARLPGFMLLRKKETLTGQNVERNLTMQLGSVQETIRVAGNDVTPPAAHASPRKAVPCDSNPTVGGTPIGGNVRAPMKTKDVRPRYPDALLASGVEGTVVLEGRLGADGLLHDLTPVSAAHSDLVKAAIDGAAQWQFEPTLLNCVPVEIPIKITVHFQR